MTVLDTTSRNQYIATSGQTIFPYTFEVFVKEDIAVLKNGVLLAEGTNYTVSGVGLNVGGNVTLTIGAIAGDVLTLYRDMDLQRETDYQNSGDFLAQEVNDDFDRLWLGLQQISQESGRAVVKPITDPSSIDMTLPSYLSRGGNVLGFDANGKPISGPSVADLRAALIQKGIIYQGAKTSDPFVRNDGSALLEGDLYFNTTNNEIRIYKNAEWQFLFALNNINSFEIADGITSWWSQPVFLQTENYSYIAYSQASGNLAFTVLDNKKGDQSTTIMGVDFDADDHNTGSVAAGSGRVFIVWPGRRLNTGGTTFRNWYVEFAEGETPTKDDLVELVVGRNYPNPYNIKSDFFLLSQIEFTASVDQWAFRLNTWPIDNDNWGPQTIFFKSNRAWPYFATRRSRENENRVLLALGWHPDNSDYSKVHVGYIQHSDTGSTWTVHSGGSQIADMSSGTNLPLDETDFEIAYDSAGTESVRLFNVHDDCFVIASFTRGGPSSTAVYKYVVKQSGAWSSYDIVGTGLPIQETVGVTYFAGAHIDDADKTIVHLCREDEGVYIYETWKFNGSSFKNITSYSSNFGKANQVVMLRPVVEQLSDDILQNPVLPYKQRAFVAAGRYNPISELDFSTSIVETQWLQSGWKPSPLNFNGIVLSSSSSQALNHQSVVAGSLTSVANYRVNFIGGSINCDTGGIAQAILGSRNTNIVETGRSAIGALATENCSLDFSRSALVACTNAEINPNTSVATEFAGNVFMGGVYNSTSTAVESAIIGSRDSTISSRNTFVGGCREVTAGSGVITDLSPCAIIGSSLSSVTAYSSSVIGSVTSNASGTRSSVQSSLGSNASGVNSSVLSSEDCNATGTRSVVIGSRAVAESGTSTLSMGVSTGAASSANRTVSIDAVNGDIFISGTLTSSHTFADIAKMMRNGEQKEIEPGYLLTIIGDKVYKANANETVAGIVAATPALIHNDTPSHWQGRYLSDEWGRIIKEEVDLGDGVTEMLGVENPNYNSEIINVPRSQRPDDWTCTGVHGIIRARIDHSVTKELLNSEHLNRRNVFLMASDGGIGQISSTKTNMLIMDIELDYASDRGYGIARVMLI